MANTTEKYQVLDSAGLDLLLSLVISKINSIYVTKNAFTAALENFQGGGGGSVSEEDLEQIRQEMTTIISKEISTIIGTDPTTAKALQDLAKALQDNPDVVQALKDALGNKADTTTMMNHIANKNNPHKVTASQVGAQTPYETKLMVDQALVEAKTYVNERISTIINSDPDAITTLNAIAEAMAANASIRDAINNAIAQKQDQVHGHAGQYAGFDGDGNMVAQDFRVPILSADPATPAEGQLWIVN